MEQPGPISKKMFITACFPEYISGGWELPCGSQDIVTDIINYLFLFCTLYPFYILFYFAMHRRPQLNQHVI